MIVQRYWVSCVQEARNPKPKRVDDNFNADSVLGEGGEGDGETPYIGDDELVFFPICLLRGCIQWVVVIKYSRAFFFKGLRDHCAIHCAIHVHVLLRSIRQRSKILNQRAERGMNLATRIRSIFMTVQIK
jgi:hypothetical protein